MIPGSRDSLPEPTPRVLAAIERAKQEWESTVDVLPDLVCLLDHEGNVVRVNRTMERWGLMPVTAVAGKDLHSVLHENCVGGDGCGLAAAIEQAWLGASRCDPSLVEAEVEDARLGMAVRIAMRPCRAVESTDDLQAGRPFAVAVVTNVTALRKAHNRREAAQARLESRVRARTEQLAEANRCLQNEVSRRAAAEEALIRSRNELALLSEQLMSAQESERRRISSDLHDCVGQSLGAIKYGLERSMELVRRGQFDDAQPVIERAVESVQQTMEEVRSIAIDLRPPLLDHLGAASAAEWLCRQFVKDYPHLRLDAQVAARDTEVPARLATALFRSLQELLANVVRHACATRIHVGLKRVDRTLVLTVQDNGTGLKGAEVALGSRHGHGLRNIRERASMTGGQFTLSDAAESGGTLARLEWKLGAAELPLEDATCHTA